ncbi:hypothetical protein AAFF_G00225940 [Aldrovandia affinis]|uniref:Uncharacterized protein n=1 Tax=Aldrovandia affinis TaxID=143900 RepID=A0AAD7TB64_9TELE|nr:hypothetical protein AAFF_G00225940 [Aldrovandia affinis]
MWSRPSFVQRASLLQPTAVDRTADIDKRVPRRSGPGVSPGGPVGIRVSRLEELPVSERPRNRCSTAFHLCVDTGAGTLAGPSFGPVLNSPNSLELLMLWKD